MRSSRVVLAGSTLILIGIAQLSGTSSAQKSPVESKGPIHYVCTQTDGSSSPITATFYQTEPALVLVERESQSRLAFQVRAASGAKYEGTNVMFWEAKGEASVTWSGIEFKCKPLSNGNVRASGATDSPQDAHVTGTISYRQRIALTPDAVVEVKLLDVSRAGAPAVTIAEQTIKPAGRQVPIAFEIRYDPSRIVARNRYVIQARILEGGQLRFINTQAYPVITGGNPTTLDMIVEPVGQ